MFRSLVTIAAHGVSCLQVPDVGPAPGRLANLAPVTSQSRTLASQKVVGRGQARTWVWSSGRMLSKLRLVDRQVEPVLVMWWLRRVVAWVRVSDRGVADG